MKFLLSFKEYGARADVRKVIETIKDIKPQLEKSIAVLQSIQKTDEDHSHELFLKQLEILQASFERTVDNVQRCLDLAKFSE
jgi:hypothetical protein